MTDADLGEYLRPSPAVDSDAPNVVAFARAAAGDETDDVTKAVRLYYAVRDGIVYTPYLDFGSADTYRASACLAKGAGFCVGKAALLAAAARAVGIPARVGFADVKNHLCTPRLRALMGSDVFFYHGYAELFLAGRWVKATPAFDRTLCERFGVRALEFDGLADSLFHPLDRHGRRHLEYLRDRGVFADVPVADIVATFAREYPGFATAEAAPETQFRAEAEQSRTASTPDGGVAARPAPRSADPSRGPADETR
jgi:transglutaminase-like putative cysteine protease